MSNPTLYIEGIRGNVGSDLRQVASESEVEIVDSHRDASFVALCVPSRAAYEMLADNRYQDTVVIDFSGAAKRRRLGRYGLMLSDTEPWDPSFDPNAKIYGNPGCIAGAAIRGLHAAGLTKELPSELSIHSVGGRTHVHSIEDNELRLGNRMLTHPHVTEIQAAFGGLTRVTSFMPAVSGGIERGLLVGVSGKTAQATGIRMGSGSLQISDVAGTDALKHRLELNGYGSGYNLAGFDFSLGVVIDNLRFVTRNAIQLINYVSDR